MAKIAVFASGSGSNFSAIAEEMSKTDHTITCLIYDRKAAFVRERAAALDIPAHYVSYYQRDREAAETEIHTFLQLYKPDLLVLAGFMRLFSAQFVQKYQGKIINIHPSLLPKYPGTHGIQESFESDDSELGITIHYVDSGMDTGKIICQKSFIRSDDCTLDIAETKIHNLEHYWYPRVIIDLFKGKL